jgi:antitoxin (DNA-binding transcriptional repressor) of toxin-antitoxin stability system
MVDTTKELRLHASKILKKVQRIGSVTVTLRGRALPKLTALNEEKVMRAATTRRLACGLTGKT